MNLQTNDGQKLALTDWRINRLTVSSGPRSARIEETVDLVNDLVLSREDTPQIYGTVREILIIS